MKMWDVMVDGARASSGGCDIVVLAASAGALKAFRQVLSDLPFDFPSAVIVVGHARASAGSMLVDLLRSHSTMPVELARSGDVPASSRVYVVPAGQDLTLDAEGAFAFVPGTFPFQGIDPLIASLAVWSGGGGTAVILTGTGADGAAGCVLLRRAGGTVVVQSTASVDFIGMGRETIDLGAASVVLDLLEIGPELVRLARRREPS